jgi:hypothetical protein
MMPPDSHSPGTGEAELAAVSLRKQDASVTTADNDNHNNDMTTTTWTADSDDDPRPVLRLPNSFQGDSLKSIVHQDGVLTRPLFTGTAITTTQVSFLYSATKRNPVGLKARSVSREAGSLQILRPVRDGMGGTEANDYQANRRGGALNRP